MVHCLRGTDIVSLTSINLLPPLMVLILYFAFKTWYSLFENIRMEPTKEFQVKTVFFQACLLITSLLIYFNQFIYLFIIYKLISIIYIEYVWIYENIVKELVPKPGVFFHHS